MSSRSARLIVGLLGVSALATIASAVLAIQALNPSQNQVAGPLVLAIGEGRRADQALAATPPDLRLAESSARRAIALAPYDSTARLKLAYLDVLDGELGRDGLEALETTYKLLPLDQYVATWRVKFALEHWEQLSPELRAAVEAEVFAFAQTARRGQMFAALSEVRSPVGVVPATFWQVRIRREDALRRAERLRQPQSR